MVKTTKAERIRKDILEFVDRMNFKHGIIYHAVQLSFKEENGENKITGIVSSDSKSFLRVIKKQIEQIEKTDDGEQGN